jgi:hypothetical protein
MLSVLLSRKLHLPQLAIFNNIRYFEISGSKCRLICIFWGFYANQATFGPRNTWVVQMVHWMWWVNPLRKLGLLWSPYNMKIKMMKNPRSLSKPSTLVLILKLLRHVFKLYHWHSDWVWGQMFHFWNFSQNTLSPDRVNKIWVHVCAWCQAHH